MFVPTVVRPVPPFAVGRAVPEYVMARVPELVTGVPVIERNAGTVAATEVTVPFVAGVVHAGTPATIVSKSPFDPTVVRPVPPLAVGIAVPE